MIAYPFRMLMCCLVTDGGGALILTSADRAKDFPTKPVYILGTGESVETPMISQMEDFTSSRAFRVAGPTAFEEAGISHTDVDHLMIYDAFAHLPIYGLEDLGFCGRARRRRFICGAQHRAGRQAAAQHQWRRALATCTPACTACTRCRRACGRCAAPRRRRSPGAKISVCHGVGGMFAASGTIIFTQRGAVMRALGSRCRISGRGVAGGERDRKSTMWGGR